MMKHIFSFTIIALLLSVLPLFGQGKEIDIHWSDSIDGDFSFTNKWSYAETIYRNDFGQLVCDGNCDEDTYRMRDENGRIYSDSIESYYTLVDTTHYYHTHSGEAECYEWIGTDFAHAIRKENVVTCHTECNVAAHSGLELNITENKCLARIILNSIADRDIERFNCKDGYIIIDKLLWDKGILKAKFHFDFTDPEYPNKSIWWKGNIQTTID